MCNVVNAVELFGRTPFWLASVCLLEVVTHSPFTMVRVATFGLLSACYADAAEMEQMMQMLMYKVIAEGKNCKGVEGG